MTEFELLVLKMRTAQKSFARTKSSIHLHEAIKLEKLVDNKLSFTALDTKIENLISFDDDLDLYNTRRSFDNELLLTTKKNENYETSKSK